MQLTYLILILVHLCTTFGAKVNTSPALFMSYNLIPGLKPSLRHTEQLPFTEKETDLYLTRALEQCSSEHYIFVKVPGLTVQDFSSFPLWHHLRARLSDASTFLSMPHILDSRGVAMHGSRDSHSVIDWGHLEKVLDEECHVSKYQLNTMDYEEMPLVIHTQKTLVNINIPNFLNLKQEEGSEGFQYRDQFIERLDELIRHVCMKFPTPKVTVLIGSMNSEEYDTKEISNVEEVILYNDLPDDPTVLSVELRDKAKNSNRYIFPDITVFDKSRYYEIERHESKERRILDELKDNQWAKDLGKEKPSTDGLVEDDTWLEKKEKKVDKHLPGLRYGENEEFHSAFENEQFIKDNALVIASCVILVLSVIFVDTIKLIIKFLARVFKNSVKPKKPKTNKKKTKSTKKD